MRARSLLGLVLIGLAGLALSACGNDRGVVAADEVRECLEDKGFRVAAGGRSADDDDAPDQALDVAGPTVTVFLALYDSEDRADAIAPQVRRDAEDFGGSVERRGKVTVVWARGKDSTAGQQVDACLT